jgi:peptide/nickel transport system substrate-binding protein
VGGTLAQSWEFTDPSTLVYHLRQGLNWQNLPPANGREFVAEDVVYSYDRLTGLGDGFTTPAVIYAASAIVKSLQSVTATGKYTVTFKWKTPSQESMVEILQSPSNQNLIVCPEAVQQYGNLNDWHHAVGTGPFICQDFVSGNSLTMVRNPNYWGYDERYPQDHLPYVNEIQYLVIPDIATAMAAMRVGKIDAMDGLTVDQAKQIAQTNPEISEIATPGVAAQTICPRVDLAPFSDIRVREALQQAINLPLIAQTYYSGTCLPYPSTLTSNYVTGMGFPYVQWPQALQDEYAYNPTNAKALLAAAGYPNGFNTTCVADSSGDLTLLQIVQSEWASVGINLSIQTMDPAAWTAYTTALQFTGLCMKAGGFLGVAYEPITQITNLSTNNLYWYGVTDPTGPALYQQALAASTVDQVYQILIQANKYVAQSHNLISLLQPTTYTLRQPWLKGYTAQNRSILTASLYPAFLNFYGARFWIAK